MKLIKTIKQIENKLRHAIKKRDFTIEDIKKAFKLELGDCWSSYLSRLSKAGIIKKIGKTYITRYSKMRRCNYQVLITVWRWVK